MEELAIYKEELKDEKKYVVFNVSKENYGIDISSVSSIIEMPQITNVPRAPKHFRGIINLRGEIIPVISLRRKMSLEDDTFTNSSRIIITEVEDNKQIGLIVDEVREVVAIPDEEIMDPSPFLKGGNSLISGVGKKDEDLISVFNLELLA